MGRSFLLAVPCEEHLGNTPVMLMGIAPRAGFISSDHIQLLNAYLCRGGSLNSSLFPLPLSSFFHHSPLRGRVFSFSLSHSPSVFSPRFFTLQVCQVIPNERSEPTVLCGPPSWEIRRLGQCFSAYFYSPVCPALTSPISPSKGPLSSTSRRMLLYWPLVRQPGCLWRSSWMKLDNFH